MWKDIRGYEGLYQVSDEGQIRRLLKNGKVRPLKNKDGLYYTVSLSRNGKYISYAVHRLVAEMFMPRPMWATEVNHKDGNRYNNRLENLEWCTQQENIDHAHKVLKSHYGKSARTVRCLDKETGKVVKEFQSVGDAARFVANSGHDAYSARVRITTVCSGARKSAFGYKWEYTN